VHWLPGHPRRLDAVLLPRRACSAAPVGQVLAAAARWRGHRLIADQLAVPHGGARLIRRARASARRLWAMGVQAVVTLDPTLCPLSSARTRSPPRSASWGPRPWPWATGSPCRTPARGPGSPC
jgi:hypothetical protein